MRRAKTSAAAAAPMDGQLTSTGIILVLFILLVVLSGAFVL